MHAIDDLGDAVDATRNFLTPVRPGLWLRLAVIVFFVSSLGFGGPSFQGGDVGSFTEDPAFEDDGSEEFDENVEDFPTESFVAALLIIFGIFLVAWLVYALIAGVMEFVFIESLRTTEVHVRRYFFANVGKGVRLFLFRLGLAVVFGFLGLAPAAFLYWQGQLSDLSGGLIGLYAIYGIVVGLLYSVVNRFTDAFVAPIMLLEDRGVFGAWSRFWTTFTPNWSEYVVYLVLLWILSLAVAIAAWIVIMFGALALAIPFVVVIIALFAAGDVGALLAIPVVILMILALLLFVSLVWTPITTYFKYYALLLLGDVDEDLDLIPDQRAAIRSDGGAGPRGDDWTGTGRDGPGADRDDGWSGGDRDSWNDGSDDSRDASDAAASDPWDDSTDDESTAWDSDDERDEDDDRDPWGSESDDDDRSW